MVGVISCVHVDLEIEGPEQQRQKQIFLHIFIDHIQTNFHRPCICLSCRMSSYCCAFPRYPSQDLVNPKHATTERNWESIANTTGPPPRWYWYICGWPKRYRTGTTVPQDRRSTGFNQSTRAILLHWVYIWDWIYGSNWDRLHLFLHRIPTPDNLEDSNPGL